MTLWPKVYSKAVTFDKVQTDPFIIHYYLYTLAPINICKKAAWAKQDKKAFENYFEVNCDEKGIDWKTDKRRLPQENQT